MSIFTWLFGKSKSEKDSNDILSKPILLIDKMTDEQRAKLKAQFEQLKKDVEEKVNEINTNNRNRVKETNSKCPRCSSTNVSNRIKRVEGEIKGESSGYGSSFLGTGSWSSHGSIKGSIDTNPINKCNKCQHEWHIKESTYVFPSDKLKDFANYVAHYINDAIRAYERDVDFNPNNLDEKCKSAEEKRAALIAELPNSCWYKQVKEIFGKYSTELAIYLMRDKASSLYQDITPKQTKYLRLLDIPTIEK